MSRRVHSTTCHEPLSHGSHNVHSINSAPNGIAAPAASSEPIKPAAGANPHEQVVTPWDVQGSVSSDGKQLAIDYDKLIDQFGTRRIDQALLDRFEKLTGRKPHILLRRGMFFSHRCVHMQQALGADE